MTATVPTYVRAEGRSYGDEAWWCAVWSDWREVGLRRGMSPARAIEAANKVMRVREPACGWRQWFADNPPPDARRAA